MEINLSLTSVLGRAAPWVERLLGLDQIEKALQTIGPSRPDFVPALLKELGFSGAWKDTDLARIPPDGPLVVVANHPHGGADGLVVLDLLLKARPDARVLGNQLLSHIRGLRPWLIEVDPLKPGDAGANLSGLRQALAHLKAGGCLLTFPAGEVASFRLRDGRIRDPYWSTHVVRLARRTGAKIQPIHISGRNRLRFQTAGFIHPRLRTALLPREMVALRGQTLRLRVGGAMSAGALEQMPDDNDAAKTLRLRCELLPHRDETQRTAVKDSGRVLAALIDAVKPELLRAELQSLPKERLLITSGDFQVWYFKGEELPHCMREIGRLREHTFRTVSEGTGLACDIDAYDGWYEQLILWDEKAGAMVGGYRMGATDKILPTRGKRGLYTTTLFEFRTDFFRRLDPALELGRSFIRPEYQRRANTLPLLWRGIGRYVAQNPRYNQLFGPVSINPEYSQASRELMFAWLRHNRTAEDIAPLVKAKNPPRQMSLAHADLRLIEECAYDLEHLSGLVTELESDGKAPPILLKHYLKLNGRLLAFNVDDTFGGCLDGLILVDLTRSDPRLLTAYLGEEGAASFLSHHDA